MRDSVSRYRSPATWSRPQRSDVARAPAEDVPQLLVLQGQSRVLRQESLDIVAKPEEEWTPQPDALARARTALDEAWEGADRPQLRGTGTGAWTVVGADAQLRLGRDGRWWPCRKERGRWAPAGSADHDPAAALADV
ncbi:hypothetical protein [Streptomyces sp. SLBN-118]|uniref:hypothetical protein n=1 Tax=Streptomyces sp. SLBN-118 TaxID=2768454 RepID=UPI00114DD60A